MPYNMFLDFSVFLAIYKKPKKPLSASLHRQRWENENEKTSFLFFPKSALIHFSAMLLILWASMKNYLFAIYGSAELANHSPQFQTQNNGIKPKYLVTPSIRIN